MTRATRRACQLFPVFASGGLLLSGCASGSSVGRAGDRYEVCRSTAAIGSLEQAEVRLARGDDRDAVPWLQGVVSSCPEYVRGHVLYQDAALRIGGDVEEAMRAFYGGLPDRSFSPVISYAKSRLCADYATRVGLLDAAIERDRSFYYAYLAKADILRELNRTSQALQMLEDAIAARPDFPEANLGLAEVLVDVGRGAEAEQYYENYIRLRPGDRPAKKDFIELLVYGLENGAKAVPFIDELLRLDPQDVEALTDQAAVAWLQGRTDDAIGLYHRVLELDPSRARAVLCLGHLYYDVLPARAPEGKSRYWVKARHAYRYFLQMRKADEFHDYWELYFGVPARLKEIAALVDADDDRPSTLSDF